jgi:hypothetical protein
MDIGFLLDRSTLHLFFRISHSCLRMLEQFANTIFVELYHLRKVPSLFQKKSELLILKLFE